MIYRVSFNPKAALVAAGISIFPLAAIAQSEAAPAWGDVTAAAILGDPAWQEYLSSNVRRSNISRWRDYSDAEYSTALGHLFHEHVASHSMTCGHPREVICEAVYS